MAIGESGRIVIEIDPELKKQLYQTLKQDGANLKDWFLENAASYLQEKDTQTNLFSDIQAKGGGN